MRQRRWTAHVLHDLYGKQTNTRDVFEDNTFESKTKEFKAMARYFCPRSVHEVENSPSMEAPVSDINSASALGACKVARNEGRRKAREGGTDCIYRRTPSYLP